MVGREAELSVLRAAVAAARSGRGRVLVVVGEAGVGKTRLAGELRRMATAGSMCVLAGRAAPGAAQVDLRPLAEAVMSYLRAHDVPDSPSLHPYRMALGRLVPEWRAGTSAVEHSPVVLGEALLRLLRAAAGDRGAVLVLEDLHAADADTLAVVDYLADHVGREPVVVFVSVRSDATGRARSLVHALPSRQFATVVNLGRLDRAGTVALACACMGTEELPPPVVELLVARAEGLPLLVEELLAGLVGCGALAARADGPGWQVVTDLPLQVPATFADSVHQRMQSLSEGERAILHAAAVLGRHFPWRLLPAASGLDPEQVLEGLRAAVGAQLVAVEDDEHFAFRHALTHEAVLADLLPPERAQLAGRSARAVEEAHPGLPEPWGELAAELHAAAGNRARAARLLLEHGRGWAERGMLAAAESVLQRAALLTEGAGEQELRIDVNHSLAEVLALAGKAEGTFEVAGALAARLTLDGGASPRRAELHVLMARAAVAAGNWSVADDQLSQARAALVAGAEGADAVLASADAVAAHAALDQGEASRAVTLAQMALERGRRAGRPEAVCEALEILGREARGRDLRAAEAAFDEAMATAEAEKLGIWRLRAAQERATVDLLASCGVERLEHARALAADAGAVVLVATLDVQIAAGLYLQMRSGDALDAARRAADVTARLPRAVHAKALVLAGGALLALGEPAAGEAEIERGLALAPDDVDLAAFASGQCRSTAALIADDLGAALSHMEEGARLLRRSPFTSSAPFQVLRALVLWSEGDEHGAGEALEEASAAGATLSCLGAGLACYFQAVRSGRWGDRGAAGHVVAGDEALGPNLEWYRQYGRRLVGQAALQDGWGSPEKWLREARAYFDSRQPSIAGTCRTLLRRAGTPVPRRGRGDSPVPPSLAALGITSREVDVLRLVAAGMTNREVAARLYLSPRTVENHVARLLVKSGLESRSDLSALLF